MGKGKKRDNKQITKAIGWLAVDYFVWLVFVSLLLNIKLS